MACALVEASSPSTRILMMARGLIGRAPMRCEPDHTIDDQLGTRLLEVVQMLVAEHQRQAAEGESVDPEPLTLRQDLFVQPQTTREAA